MTWSEGGSHSLAAKDVLFNNPERSLINQYDPSWIGIFPFLKCFISHLSLEDDLFNLQDLIQELEVLAEEMKDKKKKDKGKKRKKD